MAYRMYLNENLASDVVLAYDAVWTTTASAGTKGGSDVIDGSALANATRAETSATVVRQVIRQYSGPIVGTGTISGNLEVCVRTSISNVAANAKTYVMAKVIKPDGTLRGVLYSGVVGIAYTTTLGVHSAGAVAMTPVATTVGDRLIIELGVEFNNLVTTSYTATFQVGAQTAGSDLVNTNGNLTVARGWVDILSTLPFDRRNMMASLQAEVLADVSPSLANDAALLVEALGEQLPVVSAQASTHLEVMGAQLPVVDANTALLVEVMGIPGTYVPPFEGLQFIMDGTPVQALFPGLGWVELE